MNNLCELQSAVAEQSAHLLSPSDDHSITLSDGLENKQLLNETACLLTSNFTSSIHKNRMN